MGNRKGINTLGRFLYLNTYAILLLAAGVGVLSYPTWKFGFAWYIPQVILGVVFLSGSINIFKSWEDKKRKYIILMERNQETFRDDTFSEYMKAPCGRLLAKLVLKDLGCEQNYPILKKYRQPFWKMIKKNLHPEHHVYINPLYKENYGPEKH